MDILVWIVLPIVLLVSGLVLCKKTAYDWPAAGVVVGGFTLLMIIIIWPIVYVDTISDIKEFKATQETIVFARANTSISEYEKAALTHKIIDANKWLARTQYWANMSIFDMFYPDEVNELKPIR